MMLLHDDSPRDLEAREQLAAVLPAAEVTEPDDVGVFDVILEHPELPDHWRPRSGRPAG